MSLPANSVLRKEIGGLLELLSTHPDSALHKAHLSSILASDAVLARFGGVPVFRLVRLIEPGELTEGTIDLNAFSAERILGATVRSLLL